jgi:hypothetical protein
VWSSRPSGLGEAALTCKQPANPVVEATEGCLSILPACIATVRSPPKADRWSRLKKNTTCAICISAKCSYIRARPPWGRVSPPPVFANPKLRFGLRVGYAAAINKAMWMIAALLLLLTQQALGQGGGGGPAPPTNLGADLDYLSCETNPVTCFSLCVPGQWVGLRRSPGGQLRRRGWAVLQGSPALTGDDGAYAGWNTQAP